MLRKKLWIWIALASIAYYGCSDMNSLHDEYLKRGETIYIGQPDSVKIYTGKNRVKISCRNFDPKVAKLTVYWDFREGSALFDVPNDKMGEEIEMIVPNLEEKQYTFELVATNSEGQFPSIPLNITGEVYGSRYETSLINRKMTGDATIAPFDNNRMDFAWAKTLDNMVGVELKYLNSSNVETVLKVPNDEMTTSITDSRDDNVAYRTLYLPEENCIDTFYTDYTPVNFFEIEEEKMLDKGLFVRWNPADIPYLSLTGQNPWQNIEALWDGLTGNTGFSSNTSVVIPFNITFDLGQTARINRIIIHPRLGGQQYTFNHPRRISIYGSTTPDVTADVATWTYLGEFVSYRPSLSGGTAADDLAYLEQGEEFKAVENTDAPIRYLRLIITERWVATGTTVQLAELEVFGFFDE